jgi:hypothetical protein
MKHPATFGQVLQAIKASDLWDFSQEYSQGRFSVAVFHDDFPKDRRHVYRIEWHRDNRKPRVNLTVLRKFDAVKNCWNETVHAESGSWSLPDKRGEKALVGFIKETSKRHGKAPNPSFFSFHRATEDRVAMEEANLAKAFQGRL